MWILFDIDVDVYNKCISIMGVIGYGITLLFICVGFFGSNQHDDAMASECL